MSKKQTLLIHRIDVPNIELSRICQALSSANHSVLLHQTSHLHLICTLIMPATKAQTSSLFIVRSRFNKVDYLPILQHFLQRLPSAFISSDHLQCLYSRVFLSLVSPVFSSHQPAKDCYSPTTMKCVHPSCHPSSHAQFPASVIQGKSSLLSYSYSAKSILTCILTHVL